MNLQENIQRIKEMMKINHSFLSESQSLGVTKILGRPFQLVKTEVPYKFEIQDNKNNMIKMQITAPNGSFINIDEVDHVLEETDGGGKKLIGYNFKGKSGTVKMIDVPNVKRIIEFVDNSEKKSITISFVTFEKVLE